MKILDKFEYVFFFLILRVLLCLRNVKCEILGVSNLVVNRILLIQMFWYSKIFVFLFIDVLLICLKCLGSVLFPRIVISAFMGFVLKECQDFSCLMTGSRFWCFCKNSSVNFSVVS